MKHKTNFFNTSLMRYALWTCVYKVRLLSLCLCSMMILEGEAIFAQSCTVNAGVNFTTCDDEGTLSGSIGGSGTPLNGATTWSFVSGPTGISPTIVSPDSLTTRVVGMVLPGDYTFQISLVCRDSTIATQNVTISAYPEPPNFAAVSGGVNGSNYILFAGDSITCGGSYKITDATPLPNGWTAMWTSAFASNILIVNPTTDTPTVEMIDPRGRRFFRLRYTVTSPGGGCVYSAERILVFCQSPSGAAFRDNISCDARNITPTVGPGGIIFGNLNQQLSNIELIIHSGPDSNLILDPSWRSTGALSLLNYDIGPLARYSISFVLTSSCCNEVDTIGPIAFHNLGINPLTNAYYGIDSSYRGEIVYCRSSIPDSFNSQLILPGAPNATITPTSVSPPNSGVTIRATNVPGDTINPFVVYFDSSAITIPSEVTVFLNVQNGLGGSPTCRGTAGMRFVFPADTLKSRNIPDRTFCDFIPGVGYGGSVYIPPSNVWGSGARVSNILAPLGVSRLPNRSTSTDSVIIYAQTPGTYVFEVEHPQGSSNPNYYRCVPNGYTGVDTFEITFVENFGANAGTGQQFDCSSISELVGNRVAGASYRWRLLSKPASASDPIMMTPDSNRTILTGVDVRGVYRYEYMTSIADSNTQGCVALDTVQVEILQLKPDITAMVASDEVCPGATGMIVAGITAANGTSPPYTYTLYSTDSSQIYTNMGGTFAGLTHGDYFVTAISSDTITCATDPIFLSIGDSLAVTPYLILTGVDSCLGNTYGASYITDGDTVLANGVLVTGGVITGIPTNMPLEVTAYTTDRGCSVTSVIPAPGGCSMGCVNPLITAGQGVCDSVGSGTYSVAYSVNPTISMLRVNGVVSTTSGVAQASLGDSVVIEATLGSCVSQVVIASPTNCNDPCRFPFISVGGTTCSTDSNSYSVPYSATMGSVVTVSAGTLMNDSVVNIPEGTPLTIGVSLPSCPDTQWVMIPSPNCSGLFSSSVMLVDPCDCNDSLNIIVDGVYYFHEVITISGFQGPLPDSILLGTTSNIYLRTGDSVFVYDPLDSVAFDMVSPGIFQIDLWLPSGTRGSGNVIFFGNGTSQVRPIPSNLLTVCNRRHCVTIPTLGEWGLMILGLMLLIVGVVSYGHYWAVHRELVSEQD